jgi:hypothetical protein
MESTVLFRCSVCNAVCALKRRRSEYSKQDLCVRVEPHLSRHDLNEPKVAIRKYGIISNATEIVIPSETTQRLPIGEWMERDDTWLPDGALSGGYRPLSAPESSVEFSSNWLDVEGEPITVTKSGNKCYSLICKVPFLLTRR